LLRQTLIVRRQLAEGRCGCFYVFAKRLTDNLPSLDFRQARKVYGLSAKAAKDSTDYRQTCTESCAFCDVLTS
jgi:hypothetical protein